MSVPKFKKENIVQFILVALMWLALVYVVLAAMLDIAEQCIGTLQIPLADIVIYNCVFSIFS